MYRYLSAVVNFELRYRFVSLGFGSVRFGIFLKRGVWDGWMDGWGFGEIGLRMLGWMKYQVGKGGMGMGMGMRGRGERRGRRIGR